MESIPPAQGAGCAYGLPEYGLDVERLADGNPLKGLVVGKFAAGRPPPMLDPGRPPPGKDPAGEPEYGFDETRYSENCGDEKTPALNGPP